MQRNHYNAEVLIFITLNEFYVGLCYKFLLQKYITKRVYFDLMCSSIVSIIYAPQEFRW